jgi:hypothetical protein
MHGFTTLAPRAAPGDPRAALETALRLRAS